MDTENLRLTVRSPKTEHRAGGAARTVPIFPELLPFLFDVNERAEEGSEYVIPSYREGAQLTTHLRRLIDRAGLKVSPKP
ncbi:MAG: hypothetical protein AAGF47_12845 [Planctomycetota bacterium]